MTIVDIERHRERARVNMSRLHHQRRADGLCADCGAPSGEDYRCAQHAEKQRVTLRETRAVWRAAGLCVECGGTTLIRRNGKHKARCEVHAKANTANAATWKAKRKARKEAA